MLICKFNILVQSFIGNRHSKLERLKRVNFTLNGTLLPDGECEVEMNNEFKMGKNVHLLNKKGKQKSY